MSVKYILAFFESLLLVSFLVSLPFINFGNITGVFVCLMLMLITLRPGLVRSVWKSTAGRIAVIAVLLICLVSAGFAGFCTVKMLHAMSRDNESPSAVIVLGCQVRGERPSKMLRFRLDKAVEYLNEHKELPVIVSGGKGDDEAISEALCMHNYLIDQGIDESRIIMEDKSTTTDENLEFSFEILDKMGLPRSIVLVTDGYHQYRAQLIAEKHGAQTIGAQSASTELRFIPTYWVREWFGIFQQLFLK